MPNHAILWLADSRRARRFVSSAPALSAVVRRFVAGPDRESALQAAARLQAASLHASLDILGENTQSRESAAQATSGYVQLLHDLADSGLTLSCEVSVKLSALGQSLPGGNSVALDNARQICAAASRVGTTVTIDTEDHTTTDATFATVETLRADFPLTGCVVQAALHRSVADCRHLRGEGVRVRLCKGAYQEPESVAVQRRDAVRAQYQQCADILMAGSGYPMIATHDQHLIEYARHAAASNRRVPDSWEFQMLYGVRPGEQTRLGRQGHKVRIYIPFGPDWYPT